MSETCPTFTPAIRTSSPARNPAASLNSAVYLVPAPMIGSESMKNTDSVTSPISSRPMPPI